MPDFGPQGRPGPVYTAPPRKSTDLGEPKRPDKPVGPSTSQRLGDLPGVTPNNDARKPK